MKTTNFNQKNCNYKKVIISKLIIAMGVIILFFSEFSRAQTTQITLPATGFNGIWSPDFNYSYFEINSTGNGYFIQGISTATVGKVITIKYIGNTGIMFVHNQTGTPTVPLLNRIYNSTGSFVSLNPGQMASYVYTSNGWMQTGVPAINAWTSNGNNLFTNVTGNVGIHTSNPQATLHVKGIYGNIISQPNLLIEGDNTHSVLTLKPGSDNNVSQISLTNYSVNKAWNISMRNNFSGGNNMFRIGYWDGTNYTQPFNILPNGYVGIGTIAPATTLDVNGTLSSNYLSMKSQNTTSEGGEIYLSGAGTNTGFFIDNYSGDLRFIPNSSSSSKNMSISNTGKVFIGGPQSGNVCMLNITNTSNDEMILMDRGNCKYRIKIGGGDEKFTIFYNNKAHLLIDGPNDLMQLRGDIEVKADGIGDWVFFDDYKLPKLEEVDAYIKKNGHLPGMLSAKEIEEKHEGKIALGDFSNRLLVKIEELTLYTIDLNKKNQQLSSENQLLKERLDKIENQLNTK